MIRTGENGFVCRTTEDYVQAIRQARAGRTMPLIRRARRDVLDTYNVEAMARAYRQLYDGQQAG